MLPLDTHITFLNGSEILRGIVFSNDSVMCVMVDGKPYRVSLDDVHEVFVDNVYTVITTNVCNGKTTAKSFYVKEKAEEYYQRAFEKAGIIAHFVQHVITTWIIYQPSMW